MSRSHPAARAACAVWPLAALFLGATLLAQGCSSKDDKEGEANVTVSVQAATTENATIQDKISADAILYPCDQAAIVPRVNAPIKKFYVERGSKVHAGQLLAELEARDLAGAVTENQGGYEQAEATYNSAMQSARQDLNASKEQLDAAQKLFDSRETLHKEGAMSAKDVEDSRIALTQARNQYDLAEKSYTLKAAQGQLTAAKGKTISAEAQLSYAKIVSPINGVVTDRPFYVGDTAPSGTAILTVMDLSKVVARAYISPQQAAELHVGDAASILPGNGESEIAGKVSVVSPALDPNSTTVQVWVEAANPGEQTQIRFHGGSAHRRQHGERCAGRPGRSDSHGDRRKHVRNGHRQRWSRAPNRGQNRNSRRSRCADLERPRRRPASRDRRRLRFAGRLESHNHQACCGTQRRRDRVRTAPSQP